MKKIFLIISSFLILTSSLFAIGSSVTLGSTVHNYFEYIEILENIYFHAEDYLIDDNNTLRFHLEGDSIYVQQMEASAWVNIYAFDSAGLEVYVPIIFDDIEVDSIDARIGTYDSLFVYDMFQIWDTNVSNGLQLKWNENDTADRILNILVGGADRSLTLESDVTIGLDVTALEALSSTGILVRTAANTYAQRTIEGGTAITLTNGNGVSGNPSVAVTADAIGDTQLLYNTGQHLTTTSDVKHDSLDIANGSTFGGDIDNEGNYLLDNQSVTNLSSKGAGYWFDGDDYVTVADNDNLDFGTGDFSVVSIVQTGNDVTSDEQYIFQKHNARNSVTAGWDFFLSTGSDMTIYYADGTDRSQWRRGSGYELEINTNYILVFSLDKTANTVNIFQGGIDVGATEALGDLSTINNGVDNAVAALIGENTSAGEGWGGQIYSTKVFNLALDNTDSDDKAILNGAELPYKYIGASQTEHLDETDFATHDNWDVTNDFSDTVPGGNATYAWASNTTSTLTQVNGDMAVAPVGQKQYRLTYTCAVTTAPDGDFALTLTTGIAGTAVDLDFTAGTFNYEFETKHTPADFVISAVSGTDTEGTFSIDDISLIQIGCVANYTPEGIGNYTWQDVSGNELNGTVSSAIPINLPADDEQIAVETMTVDETMTDAIPADYVLEYIIVENQTAAADTLDFGTSEWASDIASASVIAASTQTVIVVNQFFDAETDISVSDTNANGWNSNHIINAILRRIK